MTNSVPGKTLTKSPTSRSVTRKARLEREMRTARRRTLELFAAIPDELLNVRVHDFYSPLGWHFGHIGMTEEYWVLSQALKRPPRNPDYTFLFANLPENPKDNRVNLPARRQILRYLTDTRREALAALHATDIEVDDPLLADAYAWEFALQHECQHQETITELRQLHAQYAHANADSLPPERAEYALQEPEPMEMVAVQGGTFLMGSNDRHGYDNEKCAHPVTVASFELDKTPVTVGQWTRFLADGGYQKRPLWSEAGWAWRKAENVEMPEYWQKSGRGYGYYYPEGFGPIWPHQPVTSLSWYEADAYARWCGKRLPTEAEWEYAARYDPRTGITRLYPWGNAMPTSYHADYGSRPWSARPVPVTNHFDDLMEKHSSAFGALYIAGSVWEWTATPFLPYPGFQAFPYDGYSKDHMDGTHYVCRGGSWASAARILRASFRNWYVPTYRQGFLGVRCAK